LLGRLAFLQHELRISIEGSGEGGKRETVAV
jgi:hypothetical protein